MLILLAVSVLAMPKQPDCIMDVNVCPDGSYVARDPANGCAFKPCPEIIQQVVIDVPKEPVTTTEAISQQNTEMNKVTAQPQAMKSIVEQIKDLFKPKSTAQSTSPVTVQSQNIVSANVGIDGTTIQVIGTAQKDVPKIESALMNLNETDKSTLSNYYKIHAKKKVNSDLVFLKVYKHNQGSWFKYSTSRYYYIENNALKEATSWQFLQAKK